MNISTVNSREILWCDKIKYLAIDLAAGRVFMCSDDHVKRKFYRAFNAVFLGKFGVLPPKRLFNYSRPKFAGIILWSRSMPGK